MMTKLLNMIPRNNRGTKERTKTRWIQNEENVEGLITNL